MELFEPVVKNAEGTNDEKWAETASLAEISIESDRLQSLLQDFSGRHGEKWVSTLPSPISSAKKHIDVR